MNNNFVRSRMVSSSASRAPIRQEKSSNTDRKQERKTFGGWKLALSTILRSQTALGTIAAFSSTFCLVVAGVSMSLDMMVNPEAVKWLEPLVPIWSQVPFASRQVPQSIEQIERAIAREGPIAAQPLPLDRLPSPQTKEGLWSDETGILVPVMTQCSPASGDNDTVCQKIVQLQLFLQVRSLGDRPHDSEPYYQKISELNIDGPAESFVISHLNQSNFNGSTQSLPLTKLERFYRNAPNTGIWFHLSGEATYGEEPITYGTIVHYNYQTRYLTKMMEWASTNNQSPNWQEVTGSGEPELIIDRTAGIEPHISIYQIKPVNFVINPIELEQIDLHVPALKTQGYRDGIWLAKTGLWSPAWQIMAYQKQKLEPKGKWSSQAQAQMDAIRFHAQVSEAQANASWRNPSQQVLMALLDGRWTQALEVFEAQLALGNTMNDVLTTDKTNLWDRVEMALRVNQNNVDLQAWGTLIIAAEEGEWQAKDWLDRQNAKPQARDRILKILEKRSQAHERSQQLNTHRSRIVGNASILSDINPDRWQPASGSSLTLESGQLWYQINAIGFHDSVLWQELPFDDLHLPRYKAHDYLWKTLGLHNDPKMQIIVWLPNGEQQTTTVTVKAVKFQDGFLNLLAAGKPIPAIDPSKVALTGRSDMSKPLAVSSSALEWRSPRTLTLEQLNRQNSQWIDAILPVLWYELQIGGEVLPGLQPTPGIMLNQMKDWLVQLVDLTGNGKPEAVLVLKPDPTRNISRPRTLILEDTGVLIYSELTSAKGQSVVGIAEIKDAGFTALVVETATGYTLQRWSSERNRFEF